MTIPRFYSARSIIAAIAAGTSALPSTRSAELTVSNATVAFGFSVAQDGDIAAVGALGESGGGAAYIFRDLSTASTISTQNVKLTASDRADGDNFGNSISVSGDIAIVGAERDDLPLANDQGSAYLFRNLQTASGTITQDAKLIASDKAGLDYFGTSVGISGNIAVIGARLANISGRSDQGAAYVFRNLDTASGNINQNIKLTASNGVASGNFGRSVAIEGDTVVVGANGQSGGGSAYVFRQISTASGMITENARLVASDGGSGLGTAVSISNNSALVGAGEAVYVFHQIGTASGTTTENAKLRASDNVSGDSFGGAVSLSGNKALIGASSHDFASRSNQGTAYLFLNTNTASGAVFQNVKFFQSNGATNDRFGFSVALSGDRWIVGAYQPRLTPSDTTQGRAYTGTVSSMTTLDSGNASRVINGISFVSQDDWIIGATTDNNQVTLGAGDSADVRAAGKAIYIGQSAGSDSNLLKIDGNLLATQVFIGSADGNEFNTLLLSASATFSINSIYLADGNTLAIAGDYSTGVDFFNYINGSSLYVQSGGGWLEVTSSNRADHLAFNVLSGGSGPVTFVTPMATTIPEPSAFAALAGFATLGLAATRRRFRA